MFLIQKLFDIGMSLRVLINFHKAVFLLFSKILARMSGWNFSFQRG